MGDMLRFEEKETALVRAIAAAQPGDIVAVIRLYLARKWHGRPEAAPHPRLGWGQVDARLRGDAAAGRAALAAAQASDGQATARKRSFLATYNRLRVSSGRLPLPADFAF
jgi:hypothetical protein